MIELINISDISFVVDWIEINIIYFDIPLSRSKLISLLEDNGYVDDVDYNGDALFDSILQELEKRKFLYGINPPFHIERNIIIPQVKWNDYPEYLLCLLFSYFGAANEQLGTSLFEQVSNRALKSYLNGEAITLGFPNEGNLPSQLDQIAVSLNEDRAKKNPPPKAKDDGVDVIGWTSFGDNRRGQVIILMQCAAGYNWNLKKQIKLSTWAQYINWHYETTIPSLAITEILDMKKWGTAVETYGVVFDRARIYRCLYKPHNTIETDLRSEIIDWCIEKLN